MKIFRSALIALLIIGVAYFAISQSSVKQRLARITKIEGKAEVKKAGATGWMPATTGMMLAQGDSLKTGSGSTAVLDLDGEGETANITLEPGSEIKLAEFTKDAEKGTQQTVVELAIGEAQIRAEKLDTAESKFKVKTPTSVIDVKGAVFSVKVEAIEAAGGGAGE